MIGVDYEQVLQRLYRLEQGGQVIYFVGFLDSERLERPRGVAAGVANEALAMSQTGRAFLVQRRLGPPLFRSAVDRRHGCGPGFEYIAIGARQ